MDTGTNTRRVVVGLGSMVAGAALLVGALPGGASAAPSQDQTVTSEVVNKGNPTCEDLGYDNGFRINTPDGDVQEDFADPDSDLTGSLTIVAGEGEVNATVDVTTNIPVDAVLVKAGPGYIIYESEPPTTTWTGLASPKPDVSHVDICWNDTEGTTTTTSEGTTSTTEKKHETTSTTAKETTTTMAKETTTTVEGETTTTMVAGVTTTTPEGQLPRTGSSTGPLVALGALLLAGGTALVAGTKLRRSQQ